MFVVPIIVAGKPFQKNPFYFLFFNDKIAETIKLSTAFCSVNKNVCYVNSYFF